VLKRTRASCLHVSHGDERGWRLIIRFCSSSQDLKELFNAYVVKKTGNMNYMEFLTGVRVSP